MGVMPLPAAIIVIRVAARNVPTVEQISTCWFCGFSCIVSSPKGPHISNPSPMFNRAKICDISPWAYNFMAKSNRPLVSNGLEIGVYSLTIDCPVDTEVARTRTCLSIADQPKELVEEGSAKRYTHVSWDNCFLLVNLYVFY